MKYSRWLIGIPVAMAFACTGPWAAQGFAEAETTSSCVQCHLDEDMLIGSLAEVKSKASAKQAGAG